MLRRLKPSRNDDNLRRFISFNTPVINNFRDLIYELSIPLAQLQVGLDLKKPLVYNIKVNEPNKLVLKEKPSLKVQAVVEADRAVEVEWEVWVEAAVAVWVVVEEWAEELNDHRKAENLQPNLLIFGLNISW